MTVARKPGTARVKPSMKPGAVGILVRGTFAGKRVIILRVCDRGRVLVSAPYGDNPMGLSLVDQTSLIGTSTMVKLDGIAADEVDIKAFKKIPAPEVKDITEQKEDMPKTVYPPEYKAFAEKIDGAVLAAVKSQDSLLQEYLTTPFDLDRTLEVPPHELRF